MKVNNSINDYITALMEIYYKQGDVKKFNHKVFKREVLGACHYGVVVSLCEILKESDNLSKDELIGEMQIALTESYNLIKAKLNINIPEIKIEDILDGPNVRVGK